MTTVTPRFDLPTTRRGPGAPGTPGSPGDPGAAAPASPPSGIWRALAGGQGKGKLPKGLDAAWHAAVGAVVPFVPRRTLNLQRARRIAALDKQIHTLTSEQLRARVEDLHAVFRRGKDRREHLNVAFAVVREVARREMGLHPFVEQLAAGLAIEHGCVAELATGEGKTLVATLPAVVAGWRGRGCHVITVNDYLAKRDAQWMAPVYRWCGLRVACVESESDPPGRREGYGADVTYTTNKEVAADFLRDRLAMGGTRGLAAAMVKRLAGAGISAADRLVLRGLECAIVDEADSILIDEAVTPLIISGAAPNAERDQAFAQAAEIARQLQFKQDYLVDQRYREINLTRSGRERITQLTQDLSGLWAGARRREELVTQALSAVALFQQGKQYVVQDGKVVIVDEFTGRLMPDRTWREGLHQAVEAKESLEINPMKDTLARISFQRFFRMYRRLSGMTGTAAEAWREFWQVYRLPVVQIPTHRRCIRRELPDRIFATPDAKWQAVVEEIREMHDAGRPVLVGTRTVAASEHLSTLLTQAGLEHEVLNAIHHAQEAQIVADAGQGGRVTVATNMAGRGTDIRLGPGVTERGGLHVLATERHESHRIDRQLFGRCARQGDPGSVRAYVSLDDELVERHGSKGTRTILRRSGDGAGEIRSGMSRRLFSRAQHRAEQLARRQRKAVLKYDSFLDEFLGFAGKEE